MLQFADDTTNKTKWSTESLQHAEWIPGVHLWPKNTQETAFTTTLEFRFSKWLLNRSKTFCLTVGMKAAPGQITKLAPIRGRSRASRSLVPPNTIHRPIRIRKSCSITVYSLIYIRISRRSLASVQMWGSLPNSNSTCFQNPSLFYFWTGVTNHFFHSRSLVDIPNFGSWELPSTHL